MWKHGRVPFKASQLENLKIDENNSFQVSVHKIVFVFSEKESKHSKEKKKKKKKSKEVKSLLLIYTDMALMLKY